MTLADLLTEHPFGDDRALLCTIDTEVTAGAARSAARATASMAPCGSWAIKWARLATSVKASSKENTPARQAATYSPRL